MNGEALSRQTPQSEMPRPEIPQSRMAPPGSREPSHAEGTAPLFARSMAERPVELHIEELVLDGFSDVDREVVGESLQRELTRLLTSRFAPESIRESGSSHIDGGTFDVKPGMPPEEIGRQIARSIFWGMR